MTPLKWFYSFLKNYKWQMLCGLFLTTVIAALSVVNPYISGVIVGATKHKLSSAVGFKGIAKKAFILIIVAVAHIIDSQVLGGQSSAFRSAICGIYIANEGLSILENAVKLGVPVPKQLKKFLEQLRDKGEEENA